MKNNSDKELRAEISRRWPRVLTEPKAHAQLEYILQQAGLLSKPRIRKKKAQGQTELL